jgi:hypothetical protein
MNKKNWREKVFIFSMISVVLTIILSGVAMLLYAGGTSSNPDAPGYSFWANTIGDLGRVRAWSGKDNIGSRMLNILYYVVLGISTILFGVAFRYFFIESAEKLSKKGAIALIIQGCLIVVFPFGISEAVSSVIALFMFLMAILGAVFYSISIFRTKEYPNRYGVVWIVDGVTSALFIFIALLVFVIGVYPVAVEKILWYTTLICYFIASYNAQQQIKS